MRCPNCGFENPPGFAFCGSCGTRLNQAEAEIRETRRQVAILFVDVVGFTSLAEQMDPEELRTLVGGLLRKLSAEVYVHGGRVDMFAGDALMATFGAPISHENDPLLACRTALGMLQIAKTEVVGQDQPLHIRIGINWGEVIFGRLAESDRFTVLGDVVNVASRLESAAQPDTIMVDEAVVAATGGMMSFALVGEITVKNRQKAIKAYRLLSESEQPFRERGIKGRKTYWVNREEERHHINTWLQGIVRGDAPHRIMVITGDGGVGKTRLWEESLEWLVKSGFRHLRLRCHSYKAGQPLSAATELVWALLELPARADTGLIEATVNERLGSLGFTIDGEEQQTLILMLTGNVSGSLAEKDPRTRLGVIERVLGNMLEAENRHLPLLIEFDDFHWSDSTGGALVLKVLSRQTAGGSLIIGRHKEIFEQSLAQYDHLHLKPLSDEHTLTLANMLLGNNEAELANRIAELASGNPYYLEEIVKHLLFTGFLEENSEGLVHLINPIEAIALPPTINAFITQKIDGCSSDARHLLALICFLEGEDYALISGLFSGADMDTARKELIERYLVKVLDNDKSVIPANDLVREAAIHGILIEERRNLHSRVADNLLEQQKEGLTKSAGVLRHLLGAGRNTEAIPWLLEAGTRAYDLGLLNETLSFYAQAHELLKGSDDLRAEMRIINLQLKVLCIAGKADEMLQIMDKIDESALTDMERANIAHYRLHAALLHADMVLAGELAKQALGLIKHLDRSTQCAVHLDVAQYLARVGRLTEARDEARKSLRHAEPTRDIAIIARAHSVLGNIYSFMGKNNLAQKHMITALTMNKRTDNRLAVATIQTNLSMVYINTGNVAKVIQYSTEAIQYAQELQNVFLEGLASNNLGVGLLWMGHWDEARTVLTRARGIFEQINNPSLQASAVANLGYVAQYTGNIIEAVSLFKHNLILTEPLGESQFYRVKSDLAFTYLMQGEYELARDNASEVLALYSEKENPNLYWPAYLISVVSLVLSGVASDLTTDELDRYLRVFKTQSPDLIAIYHLPLMIDVFNKRKPSPALVARLTKLHSRLQGRIFPAVNKYYLVMAELRREESREIVIELGKVFRTLSKLGLNYYEVCAGLELAFRLRLMERFAQALARLKQIEEIAKQLGNKRLLDCWTAEWQMAMNRNASDEQKLMRQI